MVNDEPRSLPADSAVELAAAVKYLTEEALGPINVLRPADGCPLREFGQLSRPGGDRTFLECRGRADRLGAGRGGGPAGGRPLREDRAE